MNLEIKAKNLLEGKTCSNCDKLERCTSNSKEYCGPAPLSEDLYWRPRGSKECSHPPLPKEKTCEYWS